MGAWGTAISSNDTYADVRGEFFELYNNGETVSAISSKLVAINKETINDPDDCNNFWFALAKAQWECKELDPDLFDRVSDIIASGSDLEVWRSLDADEKSIAKRKIALEKFITELRTERPKAKPRKKKIIRQPPFEKGDCLAFKLKNGNYGGAVVLEAIRDTEYGYCLLATTRINQSEKPVLRDFETAEILVMNYATWEDKPCLSWYFPLRYKKVAHLIETIGKVDVQNDFKTDNSRLGFMGDFEVWIIHVANLQFESEEQKPRSAKKITVRELATSKNSDPFDKDDSFMERLRRLLRL